VTTYDSASVNYNDPLVLYDGTVLNPPGKPLYTVVVKAFLNDTTYAPGAVVAEFQNVKNLGWGEYLNDLSDCFFTINQDDPKIALLASYLKGNAHVQVYRDGTLVWGGWLMESDENQEDVVFTAYSYVAGLYWLLSDWAQEFTAAQIDTIISSLWTRAKTTLSDSGLAWVTTGTIEAPVTTSGGLTALVQAFYRIYFKRILLAFKELTAMSISDTTNVVSFEITPAGVFNYWKNRGQQRATPVWEYPSQRVIGFRRIRNMADRRNVLYGVGTSPRSATFQSVQEDAVDRNANMRREEAIYYSWVRDQTELDRVSKLRLLRAQRDDSMLILTFAPNTVIPWRGLGAEYELGDRVKCRITRGLTSLSEYKMVTGQQIIVNRGSEYLRVFVQDTLG